MRDQSPRDEAVDLESLADERRALVSAALAVRASRIDVSVESLLNGYRIAATYDVEVLDRAQGSFLLIDYTSCPFPITEIETTVGQARDVGPEAQQRLFVIDCPRPIDSARLTIRVVMEWPAGHIADGVRIPYFVAPDHLPWVVIGGRTETSHAQPALHLSAPAHLRRVGLLPSGGNWVGDERPQLQVALLPDEYVIATTGRRMLFAGSGMQAASIQTLSRVEHELEEILTFHSSELGVDPAMRLAVVGEPSAAEFTRPMGAVLVADAEELGVGSNDFRLLASEGVALAAGIW